MKLFTKYKIRVLGDTKNFLNIRIFKKNKIFGDSIWLLMPL